MTPSNSGYYVAAYIVASIVYSLYGLSIVVRTRALRERMRAGRTGTAE